MGLLLSVAVTLTLNKDVKIWFDFVLHIKEIILCNVCILEKKTDS